MLTKTFNSFLSAFLIYKEGILIGSEVSKGATSEGIMGGGGVRSILLFPSVARCLETINGCTWSKFVFMSVVVTVWGSVGMFVV